MSKIKCVEPTATFLAMMEIIILSNDSKDSGSSTLINTSSAGAILRYSFQTIQPPTLSTICCTCLGVKFTLCQSFHRICCPGGRGYGSRRNFGDDNPGRSYNWYDYHRGSGTRHS